MPSVELVNAFANYTPDGTELTIGLWARNLFDERFFNQKLNLTGIGTLASLGAPRTYGIDLRYRF